MPSSEFYNISVFFQDEVDGPGIPPIPPTNYLHISKHDSPVNEQVILDLSMVPPPLPPGVASGTVCKNLTLHTTNGHVTAEIWIRHDGSTESKRVSMDLSTDNGAVRATVVRRSLDYSTVPCTQIAKREKKIQTHNSTTVSLLVTEASVHFRSSTWSCVLIMEMYISRFPVAFAGQLPSALVTTG